MKLIVASLAVLMIAVCACGPKKKYESEAKTVSTDVSTDRVNITERVGYDTVTQFIASLAKEKDLDAGKQAIIGFLRQHYPAFDPAFLNKVDLHALRTEMLKRIE